jgi:hypothetical protein
MLLELIDSLINEIGIGLNESTIRSRLLTLREQAEAQDAHFQSLESEVNQLKAELQKPKVQPQRGELEEGAVKFLQLLWVGEELSVDQIASKLQMTKGMADYHCGVLSQKGMIHPMSIGIVLDFEEPAPNQVEGFLSKAIYESPG